MSSDGKSPWLPGEDCWCWVDTDGAEALTPREWEVLKALGEGSTDRAIAKDLGISERTVRFHVDAIFAKLQTRSRVRVAVIGYAMHLATCQKVQ